MTKMPKIVQDDPWLEPYTTVIESRIKAVSQTIKKLTQNKKSLTEFASGHHYYGLHKTKSNWVFREWAPNAREIFLIGDFNNWEERSAYKLSRIEHGDWEVVLPAKSIKKGDKYKLLIRWGDGKGERLPSYANRCVQDENTKLFDAIAWPFEKFEWKHESPVGKIKQPLIYEAHIGMATEEGKVGTFNEFRQNVLPIIKDAGYNTIQLMAIQEHPYYGSFGYHVSNFFAVSSRFGTPEELKELIDEAHHLGLAVIMDIVHSHSVRNENEGLGLFDGSHDLYFHKDHRREHKTWDSLCFDYGKPNVIHFLLSNCRYWLEEFKFDGFRFDGVTSMLYLDHGIERDFTSYEFYFDGNQDLDAINYLTLANILIHEISPKAITIAEEMSGMPGLAEKAENGGYGFDYRLAMGTPDYWIKTIKEKRDEEWDMAGMFYELTSRRETEKVISYCESHDQAMVGDKTIIFRLLDQDMYWHMNKDSQNYKIDRGIALHKMIRLVTFATNGGGYLNFMGNEFGHPEWIDFPREGNNWSYHFARRQWSLMRDENLRYHYLSDFDKAMLKLQEKFNFMEDPWCFKVLDNDGDKTLAFHRGTLLFIFNFHPTKAFSDYGIATKEGGKYDIVFCTDSKEFGGFGNINESLPHITERHGGVSGKDWLKVYMPPRTAIVLEGKKTPSVFENTENLN